MGQARIAVLDDDATHLELLTTLLEDEGYEVVGQADLRAGFIFIQNQAPTLVLMDIFQQHQPIGLEVIAALKADPYLRAVQIVVLSADASTLRQYAEQFVRDGITAVDKPYDMECLLELVRDRLHAGAQPSQDHLS